MAYEPTAEELAQASRLLLSVPVNSWPLALLHEVAQLGVYNYSAAALSRPHEITVPQLLSVLLPHEDDGLDLDGDERDALLDAAAKAVPEAFVQAAMDVVHAYQDEQAVQQMFQYLVPSPAAMLWARSIAAHLTSAEGCDACVRCSAKVADNILVLASLTFPTAVSTLLGVESPIQRPAALLLRMDLALRNAMASTGLSGEAGDQMAAQLLSQMETSTSWEKRVAALPALLTDAAA